MIERVENIDNLNSLAKVNNQYFEFKNINKLLLEDETSKGWELVKENKHNYRIRRLKPHHKLLEDRVWVLLYKMRFNYISSQGGALLTLNIKDPNSPTSQIDVLGIDDEIALAIECKSAVNPQKRSNFQEDLGKHALNREILARSVRECFPSENKRTLVYAMFLSNIILSENDKARAKEANAVIFDDNDLSYYEKLILHLGAAARYQFLADLAPGKAIPGLKIRIPAIRTKVGGDNCYTFSIAPEYLLKISYISHRSKGKASDINAYQRMISKSRLNKIKDYISKDGVFPTNIVINIEQGSAKFSRIEQNSSTEHAGILGWLELHPSYKSAWIIDGQHRLFAYSGLKEAKTDKLSILAFEGLKPSKQAEYFIDINAKQKSVKQSLLQELYAELHWDSDDIRTRITAVISKAIQSMGEDSNSPFKNRIQTNEKKKDPKCCITLTSLFGEIEKKGFYIEKEKNNDVISFGALWAGNNDDTLIRTTSVLNNWFDTIVSKTKDWWDIGSGVGGGLAMNDGVATCIRILRNAFEYLELKGIKLNLLSNVELSTKIKPIGVSLGEYFGSLTEEERKKFRDLRGIQGLTTRHKKCQQAINERISDFNPPGLEDFIKTEKAQTNINAKRIIDYIEETLQRETVQTLKVQFGNEEINWWISGVPKTVRQSVSQLFEEDNGVRGGKEFYFDLIHYKKIIVNNWLLFENLFGFGKGSKDKKTEWIDFVNDKRKIVAHKSSGIMLSIEDLDQLEKYENWLKENIEKDKVQ